MFRSELFFRANRSPHKARTDRLIPLTMLLGAVTHIPLAIYFLQLDLALPVVHHTLSTLSWVACFFLARNGKGQLAVLVGNAEIVIFITSHLIWLGPESGVYLWLAANVILTLFLCPDWSWLLRFSFLAAVAAALLAATFLALEHPALRLVGSESQHVLLLFNAIASGLTIFAFFTLLSWLLEEGEIAIYDKSRDQEGLLQVLSHDLKNLIGGISVLSALMTAGKAPEAATSLVSRNADQALSLIDVIRRLFALETGKLDLSPCHLKSCASTSQSILSPAFEAKNIALLVDVPEEILVEAEQTSLINCVLNNLLTNALKFSSPGSWISVQGTRHGETVSVRIKDEGLGIPPDMLEKLFDPNVKTSRQGTQGEEGTGFGMNLVRRFMLAYGGKITVDSQSDPLASSPTGTTVTLQFKAHDRHDALR